MIRRQRSAARRIGLAASTLLAALAPLLVPSLALADVVFPSTASAQLALELLRTYRSHGCAGHNGSSLSLRRPRTLDIAAARWGQGEPLEVAGYRAESSVALQYQGSDSGLGQAVRQRLCRQLTQSSYRDVGLWGYGNEVWILLATPFQAPQVGASREVSEQLLEQINAARARSRRCGARWYAPAPPLQLDARLGSAAERHAQDMLAHNFFDHRGSDGSTPATRVAATGYRYHMVGENIASGVETVREAVQGWLASPGHCENIMDSGFRQTGMAFSVNRRGEPRIYWVQDFATPAR